jgi:hypothetical protein
MADAYKTRNQLVSRALEILGVVASGQAPAPEDTAKIDNLVDPLIARLAEREIAYVADVNEMDLALFEDVAVMLAGAAKFGRVPDTSAAESSLREITWRNYTQQNLKTDTALRRGYLSYRRRGFRQP